MTTPQQEDPVNVDRELRRLARGERMIAERDREIAGMQAQQTQARDASVAAKERFAVALLRARGALDLPAEALAALLSNLGTDVDAGHGAIIAAPPPLQAEAHDGQEQLAPPEPGDTVQVRVRISRNSSEDKRDRLTRAGLRWNGRSARWIGRVDRRQHDELVAAFGDRVSVAPVAGDADRAAVTATVARLDMPAVVPPAAASPATAVEPRRAASDGAGGTSAAPAGEAAQAGSPAAEDRPAAGGTAPTRPRLPMRPMFGRPGQRA